MAKKVWSGILPVAILIVLILGIFLLGRIGSNIDEKVIKKGIEATATTLEPGKRMVQVSYCIDSEGYTTGVGKPFSYLQAGEKYKMKYLQKDPKSIVVFFDKPVLSGDFNYLETECTSLSKSLSVINFEYHVEGKRYKREALFDEQPLNKNDYVVKYRKSKPSIGYLVKK